MPELRPNRVAGNVEARQVDGGILLDRFSILYRSVVEPIGVL
jgi:hypothetical protein